ncbi:BTAD domain-containing putative transcriptional regulator [Paenibacillus azoreducens]|uniref:BTAD domain-containing putative transcriptional regulator n=1 Tax=Paenibacillus azoreducens TaxID=116718 RepID=UPI0039F5AE6F
MKSSRILKMKLMAPPAKKIWLQRPDLMKRLRHIPETPLTIVASGPGFGKTTALSSYVRQCGCRYAWYSISPQDHDLLPFLLHLTATLRASMPGFGEALLLELGSARIAGLEDVYALADLFLNEGLKLDGNIILCMDDYHSVEHSEWIDAWMQYVISYLPACGGLRLVISSRTKPDWESLAAMRVRGEVLELSRADLAFSAEDIEVLFSDYYNYPLTEPQAEAMYAFTEGWIIAIQLIWQRLSASKDSLESILTAPRESLEDLFHYLAAELFQKQNSVMRTFMLETSIFDELTGEWCDAVCGRQGSHALLAALCQNGFLSAVDDRQFRYHALFRQFLQDQLRRQPQWRLSLHRQAVQVFAARGRIELALSHAAELDDPEEMAQLLAAGGAELVRGGHLEAVLRCLGPIPERLKNRMPYLYVLEGDILRYRCEYEAAMAGYRKAESFARETGNAVVHGLALEGQAMLYLDTIQPGKAEPLLVNAIALAESHAASSLSAPYLYVGGLGMYGAEPDRDRKRLARLYAMMAENKLNQGQGTEAGQWAARSLELDQGSRDLLLEARLALRTGKLKTARNLLEQAQRLEGEKGGLFRGSSYHSRALSRSHREIDLLQSLIDSLSGEPLRAKAAAEAGMMQGIRLKAPYVEACGWIRMGHAAQLTGVYDVKVAGECYHAALAIMKRIDIARGTAEPNMGLCLLHGREQHCEAALRYGEAALQYTEQALDGWLSSLIRLSMGIAFYESGRWQEADTIFEEAKGRYEACGDRLGLALSELWLAMTAYRQEQDGRFAVSMEHFLELAVREEYGFLFTSRTLLGPTDPQQLIPLLLEAARQGIGGPNPAAILTELGMEKLTYHPGYTLHIETLGAFRVRLGNRVVLDKDWQRGKAKELFQLLVTKRRYQVSKEELLLYLFPEADEKAANRDFKVALNALHSALEPHRRVRSDPYFVVRDGQFYRLNLQASWTLDIVEFERLTLQGLESGSRDEAAVLLEQALLLYKGDYMPERRYDDWCIEERERLQVLFLRGAERLSQIYSARGLYDKAIRWAEAMLEKDRCWEEAYRLLMECHLQLGNRHQALKWHQRAADALAQELGIEPMASIRELFTRCSEENA